MKTERNRPILQPLILDMLAWKYCPAFKDTVTHMLGHLQQQVH